MTDAAIRPIDYAALQLGRTMAAHQDAIVLALLHERAPELRDATLAELRHADRLHAGIYPDGTVEFKLDGAVLTRFAPPEFKHAASTIGVTQRYEIAR